MPNTEAESASENQRLTAWAMKALTKIKRVSEKQVAFGRKIGLDLRNCTIGVASANIMDLIAHDFWGADLGKPTQKQIDLAREFGYDISAKTYRVGSAVISDIMEQLNLEAIEEQNLKAGDKVVNKWDRIQQKYVISSIQDDGTVYFKGGNGKRAWARNLIKVDTHGT